MSKSLAEVMAAAWDEALRDTPDPWRDVDTWSWRLGGPRLTYRACLDRPRRNHAGAVIPRITIVRGNLRRLGTPRRPPRLPA